MIGICDDLRKSVLQAAIQGRLTQQLPEDGDAETLYAEIQKEKQKLIKEGKIKKEKPLPEITDDDIPFDIPENWKWVRWGNLSFSIQYGYNAPALQKGRIHMVRISDIQNNAVVWNTVPYCNIEEKDIPDYLLEANDILFARTGGTVGKSYLVKEVPCESIYAGYLIRTRYSSNLVPSYMKYFMESQLYWDQLKEGTTATAQPNCNGQTLSKMLIPLPPLAEQKRIVACVDELMKRIDEMEKTEKDITALYAAFPGDMKASLLQAAIQGKLTEQLASDGDAETLYAESQKEKQRLIKEGKIKKEKPLPEITNDDIPFDIPENWKWVHIPDVTYFQEGPGILAVDFRSTGIPLIRISGMQGKIVTLNGCNYLDPTMVKEKWNHFRLEKGDIVISTSASMDKISEVTEEAEGAIPYTGQIRFKMYDGFDKRFFVYFIQSPFYTHQIEAQAAGAAIKHYGPSHLRKMLIPLPPLAEQKRIVEKLDQLLPLCDSMKEAIDATA